MNWQPTDTVLGIIREMREKQDYTPLPILADAMQDADYPDEGILAAFRMGPLDLPSVQRQLCLILGGEYAQAVKRIEEIAEELGDNYGYDSYEDDKRNLIPTQPMNYEVLMNAADDWINDKDGWGNYLTQQGHENWRDDFPRMAEEFWNNYEVVTGRAVEDKQASFFSCSC